jgi:ABC-type nitrate/sulfonate/bicarbonate transport system ATPase subunit
MLAAIAERAELGHANRRAWSIRSPKIQFQDLSIGYGSFTAVAGISLDIADSEFVCLLGPSGCGKTTLLNAIAGFVSPSAGRLLIDGRDIEGPGPDRGMVFQEYALFPWFTVEQNVAYGPRLRGVRGSALAEITRRYLELVRLSHAAKQYPNQLSGGMRQRVAIARALANEPSTILMDEPFGALDAMTREALQDELVGIWEKEQRTCLFVTHSVAEAIYLGDRIVVMSAHPGRVRAVVENPIARPRDRASESFFALYREINAMLRTEGGS